MPPKVSRTKVLASPRSGAHAGAARGGIAGGQPVPPAPQRTAPPRRTPARKPAAAPPQPAAPAPAAAPAQPAAAPPPPAAPAAPGPGRVSVATTEGSGALLALFAYPLAFNLLRHGPAGMWGWIRAKFTNQPWTGTPDTSGVGTAPGKIPGTGPGGGGVKR